MKSAMPRLRLLALAAALAALPQAARAAPAAARRAAVEEDFARAFAAARARGALVLVDVWAPW
jgi:hypothetical protein